MKTKVKKAKRPKKALQSETAIKITKIAEGFKVSPVEAVMIGGDLAVLSSEQRFNYYLDVCRSLRLNPLTQPFGYISMDGEMKLYAKKDCAEQLRKLNGIGVTDMKREMDEASGILTVEVKGLDKWGKVDIASGSLFMKKVVWDNKIRKEYPLTGQDLANAKMKCETKAKRRLALSMSGLSMPDESEVIDIQGVKILEAEEKQTEKALKKVEALPEIIKPGMPLENQFFNVPINPKPQTVAVHSERPMDKVITSLPEKTKALLKEAGYDTLSKAYAAYKQVAGDVDALDQLCEEKIRGAK